MSSKLDPFLAPLPLQCPPFKGIVPRDLEWQHNLAIIAAQGTPNSSAEGPWMTAQRIMNGSSTATVVALLALTILVVTQGTLSVKGTLNASTSLSRSSVHSQWRFYLKSLGLSFEVPPRCYPRSHAALPFKVPADKIQDNFFQVLLFLDPSKPNEHYHTPILSEIWRTKLWDYPFKYFHCDDWGVCLNVKTGQSSWLVYLRQKYWSNGDSSNNNLQQSAVLRVLQLRHCTLEGCGMGKEYSYHGSEDDN